MARKQAVPAVTAPQEGQLWAVPVPGMGYCPLVVARVPRPDADVKFAFAYLQLTLHAKLPSPHDVRPLSDWRHAWLGLVTLQPFQKHRWQLCGDLPGFQRDQWPVPPTRASAVDETKPEAEWDQHPWGELWSIETTADEPTMTPIANTPATREEARRFPFLNAVTAPSSLEKGLTHYFKNRRPGFWDMTVIPEEVSAVRVELWARYAANIREGSPEVPPTYLPAGRKTDRNLQPGSWLALPLRGGGFGAAMLIDKPDPGIRCFSDSVVMAMRRSWDHWPTLADVEILKPEDGAFVAQTSMICVRDGRWRVIGLHPGFDPTHWVWPLPWWQSPEQRKRNVIQFNAGDEPIEIRMNPDILELDADAGQRCSGGWSYDLVELEIPRLMSGRSPFLDRPQQSNVLLPAFLRPLFARVESVVTPQRLHAWRRINEVIRQAVASSRK